MRGYTHFRVHLAAPTHHHHHLHPSTHSFSQIPLSGDFSLSPRRHFPNSILRNGAVIIVVTAASDDDDFQSREQGIVKMMSAFVTCTKGRKVELENDMHSTSSNNNSFPISSHSASRMAISVIHRENFLCRNSQSSQPQIRIEFLGSLPIYTLKSAHFTQRPTKLVNVTKYFG